ncbi:MAG TPA: nucleotidyltransferase-like protein [Bacilli bacterium]
MTGSKLADFLSRYQTNENICGVLAIKANHSLSPLTGGFDLLILAIYKDTSQAETTFHYIKDDVRIQEKRMDSQHFADAVLAGTDRSLVQWVLQGEIVFEKDSYLAELKRKLSDFPRMMREQKILIEFSRFLRSYLQSKQDLHDNQVLDSYANILEALTHWARIAIIEHGQHPEVTVWDQLREINPGIYKLYEELTTSLESVEQRVQLVLLACEFSVMSKMSQWCALLLRILRSRKKSWAIHELYGHANLKNLHLDLGLLLRKLVARNLVKEVVMVDSVNFEKVQLRYSAM